MIFHFGITIKICHGLKKWLATLWSKNMARPPSWIKGALLLREGGYRKEGEREGMQGEGKKRRGG